MAKRNSKREPVKEIEEVASEDEDELDELELDGNVSDTEDERADDGEADDEDEAGDVDAEGNEDEIEDAMLELMAAQAEEAQRRAAARAASGR